jgi:hypothetical protein
MATAKKATNNKSRTVKKAPAKKASSSRKAAPAPEAVRSFKVAPNTPAFKTFKTSRQTFYWVILVAFIVYMQLWIVALQDETSRYLDAEENAISASIYQK